MCEKNLDAATAACKNDTKESVLYQSETEDMCQRGGKVPSAERRENKKGFVSDDDRSFRFRLMDGGRGPAVRNSRRQLQCVISLWCV